MFDMNGNCPIHSLIAAGISSSKNYKQEDQQVFLAKLSEVVLSLGLTGTNMDIADGSGNAALHVSYLWSSLNNRFNFCSVSQPQTATIAKLDVLVQSLLKANANPNVQVQLDLNSIQFFIHVMSNLTVNYCTLDD